MVLLTTGLLACGGKATYTVERDAPESEEGETTGAQTEVASEDESESEGEESTKEPEAPAPAADGPSFAQPGEVCEVDEDCGTDFCDLGVCFEPNNSVERAGETGAVYAAGHGAYCDRATPCFPLECKNGRCRY